LDQAGLLEGPAVLAYVFWHRPREGVDVASYEQEHVAFHSSLARTPPVGLRGSYALRVPDIPWLAAGAGASARRDPGGYEDWYLIDDFTALGVLNEAAVGRGHRTSHDRVARDLGAGAAGVYALDEGQPDRAGAALAEAAPAIWVAGMPGSRRPALGDLLGDGMDPLRASLWRRQLVLGPAPEFCLVSHEASAGVAADRLPEGWSALTVLREPLFGG
jgi:hypothetical protein